MPNGQSVETELLLRARSQIPKRRKDAYVIEMDYCCVEIESEVLDSHSSIVEVCDTEKQMLIYLKLKVTEVFHAEPVVARRR